MSPTTTTTQAAADPLDVDFADWSRASLVHFATASVAHLQELRARTTAMHRQLAMLQRQSDPAAVAAASAAAFGPEPAQLPGDPLAVPLPCPVTIGLSMLPAGTPLSVLVDVARTLYRAAARQQDEAMAGVLIDEAAVGPVLFPRGTPVRQVVDYAMTMSAMRRQTWPGVPTPAPRPAEKGPAPARPAGAVSTAWRGVSDAVQQRQGCRAAAAGETAAGADCTAGACKGVCRADV
ncbi:MAG: hypothetical protein RIQ53_4190 [Pseudomonadota bacterium]|jgi:hypothetical protein